MTRYTQLRPRLAKGVSAAAIGAAMLIGTALSAPPAEAGYIVTLTQVGTDVVATGSGTIDLTGLTFNRTAGDPAAVFPSAGGIITGPATVTSEDAYGGFSGPASFGSGGFSFADSGSGDVVGIVSSTGLLSVPSGYVSGSALSDTATYDNQTFATLGITPGSYVWTWGSGTDADSFTLDVGVPEPGSLALLATALIGLGALGWSRRRRAPNI
ncbi:MAG TPA: PEP-CTERM sorting domain-containing protein [Acetobacteraceae bacterium]|nr:PEP-CTERM sorting domain-containing protein [Acetobacteraceae bacterium]